MHIIFPTTLNKTTLLLIAIALLTTLTPTHSQVCQPFQYHTPFTRCKMSLQQCISTPTSTGIHTGSPYYQFKDCTIQHCITLGSGPDCHSYNTIQLDQTSCYRSCCKSQGFLPQQCAANNVSSQQHTERANSIIGIVLSVCALGLVLSACFFLVFKLKFLEKKQARQEESLVPVWRRNQFNDHKCDICDGYGAIIETACEHYFHLECYKYYLKDEILDGQCAKCKESSRRFRLWCNDCHQRYIKVSFGQIQTAVALERYYHETKVLHLDCLKDIDQYLKTDVRITTSSEGTD